MAPIFKEEALILRHEDRGSGQFWLELEAPRVAACAEPGSFVHLTCHPLIPLRRPFSIMGAEGKVLSLLYQVVGKGTRWLSRAREGERLSLLGPIGRPFALPEDKTRPLLIGGGVGIPPVVFLAQRLRDKPGFKPLVLMGSERPFPFETVPSRFPFPLPGASAAAAFLEAWGIPSRLASLQGYPGCFRGHVTELARRWLATLSPEERGEVAMFACGPVPMLEAAARLAFDFHLPCQVAMEAFMACGVGGCAGCTVRTREGMRRVCVDGPVFDAREVF